MQKRRKFTAIGAMGNLQDGISWLATGTFLSDAYVISHQVSPHLYILVSYQVCRTARVLTIVVLPVTLVPGIEACHAHVGAPNDIIGLPCATKWDSPQPSQWMLNEGQAETHPRFSMPTTTTMGKKPFFLEPLENLSTGSYIPTFKPGESKDTLNYKNYSYRLSDSF